MAKQKHIAELEEKRKYLTMSRGGFLPALVTLAVFPLWAGITLPLAIVLQSINLLLGRFRKKIRSAPKEDEVQPRPDLKKPLKEREYDVVLLGATGFTGGLGAKYLAKQYGMKGEVAWAIAGRRKEALEKLRNDLGLPLLPIIVADTSDSDSLHRLVSCTRAVVTTAGPFSRYGTELVKHCVAYGTHYADTTGETDWVREMIDRFDAKAQVSGSRIVHYCAHDCVPWDLCTMAVADELKKKGEELSSISFQDYIRSAPSGGTLETMMSVIFATEKYKASTKFDPLLRMANGEESTHRTKKNNQARLGYDSENKVWVGPAVMAMVMADSVKRSNALLGYGSNVVYKEAVTYPSFFAGLANVLGLMMFGMGVACPPALYLLKRFILPKPGQGPSEDSLSKGFLKVVGQGRGTKGTMVTVEMYFPNDPGYVDTSRMAVESGIALAVLAKTGRPAPTPKGGVFTPAPGIGSYLVERLTATGSTFKVQMA